MLSGAHREWAWWTVTQLLIQYSCQPHFTNLAAGHGPADPVAPSGGSR